MKLQCQSPKMKNETNLDFDLGLRRIVSRVSGWYRVRGIVRVFRVEQDWLSHVHLLGTECANRTHCKQTHHNQSIWHIRQSVSKVSHLTDTVTIGSGCSSCRRCPLRTDIYNQQLLMA